jgi:thiamine pyrophosphokinase
MPATAERQPMELRGLRRHGDVLSAILVLRGASDAALKRACALCAMVADRVLLVAIDGGLRTCQSARRRPDLFVGDGDSSRRVPTEIPKIVYPPEKEFSDLAGALTEIRKRRVQVVGVAGLLGGRLDHEWANLQEIGSRAPSFAGIIAPTDRGTVLITSHGCRTVTLRARPLSLLPLTASATVTLLGTEHELHRRRIRAGYAADHPSEASPSAGPSGSAGADGRPSSAAGPPSSSSARAAASTTGHCSRARSAWPARASPSRPRSSK